MMDYIQFGLNKIERIAPERVIETWNRHLLVKQNRASSESLTGVVEKSQHSHRVQSINSLCAQSMAPRV